MNVARGLLYRSPHYLQYRVYIVPFRQKSYSQLHIFLKGTVMATLPSIERITHKFEWHYGWVSYYVILHILATGGLLFTLAQLLGGLLQGADAVFATHITPQVLSWQLFAIPWWGRILQAVLTTTFGYYYWRFGLYSITFMHLYYSHTAFRVLRRWIHWVTTLGFYSALQGWTALWTGWHRQHHELVDTKKDRTSPQVYGFWHAHMFVWMKKQFLKPAPRKYSWHLRHPEYRESMKFESYYVPIAIFMAFGVPTLVGSLLLNPLGGFLMGCTRLVALYHTTWTINSRMHTHGDRVEGGGTATNTRSRFFSWMVVGEPGHANHHRWPWSYRRGEVDPGADLIEWLAKRGWVSGLKLAPLFKK